MNLTSVTSEVCFLVRHLKKSHYGENNQIKDDAFQLREDRCPPEEYISFYHSNNNTNESRVLDVIDIFKRSGFILKSNCGFAHLDICCAISEINTTREIIQFKEYNYPHYGMHFLTNDDVDIVEAKTVLIYCSQLYKYADITKKLI